MGQEMSRRLILALVLVIFVLPTTAGAQSIFTIPVSNPANGLYLPDIQASFSAVNWQALDVLCIPAAHYKFINIGNLPQRSAAQPLVVTNCGGQVRVGALGHYYMFVIGGGSNWKLTGRYVAGLSGDSGFTGHANGNYANSSGHYGILVDDESIAEGGPSGFSIGGGASDFEIEYVEVAHVGFAGMSIKTDNNAAATMNNVRIHDTYVHDTGSEGFYIGSTQAQPQHALVGFRFYNNRVLRTGTEIFQFGQIGANGEVYNNVFLLGALDWKHPFQAFQDNGTQLGPRFGSFSFHNNIVIGAAASWINFLGSTVGGDPHQNGDTVSVNDNYFSHSRGFGAYIARLTDAQTEYHFERNRLRHMVFQRDEIDPVAPNYDQFFRLGSGGTANTSEIRFVDNLYDGTQHLINNWTDPNQTVANVSGTGNQAASIPALRFVDSGYPSEFDYLKLEIWTADTSAGVPVSYEFDDIASVDGVFYRCTPAAGCGANLFPPDHPEAWELQPMPADDVRLSPDSPIQGVGLLDLADLIFASGFESP
jgi:hypothetical protein